MFPNQHYTPEQYKEQPCCKVYGHKFTRSPISQRRKPAGGDPGAGQAREAVTCWGVPDAEAAHARLLALGAREYQPVQDVGGGIKLGAVLDPQGNVLGVIENPHFVEAQTQAASQNTER